MLDTRDAAATAASAQPASLADTNEELNDALDGGHAASGSTHAKTKDRTVTITGLGGDATYTHGGPAAHVDDARFTVENGGATPRSLAVTAVEYVQSQSCSPPLLEIRSRPTFTRLTALAVPTTPGAPSIDAGSAASISIPASSALTVRVHFDGLKLSADHCVQHGFRVRFSVDGEPVVATAETIVVREEPQRKR